MRQMADDVKQGTLGGFFKKLPPGQKAPSGMPTKRTPQLEAAIAARIEDQNRCQSRCQSRCQPRPEQVSEGEEEARARAAAGPSNS
jgi:hypothetical protein